MNDDYNEEDMSEQEEMMIISKLLDTLLVFNKHFSAYIREVDEDLFKRAVDYAKTFTEEDVSGIVLDYIDEKDENEKD